MKITPKTIILNQDFVREKLRQKKYDEVCLSSWGRLDEFIQFISSVGVFSMLAQLGLATGHSGIPSFLLAMLAFAKPVFNIRFDDNIKYLFQDAHVLRLLGFNFKQIQNRYSKELPQKAVSHYIPILYAIFYAALGTKKLPDC